ncbi:MAG: shikimate kinase [Phascolarctobacterium sp.]|nr:shikimate kinase [Phascolarctobacterium sp.]MCD8174772.1 shikimate kinase [Phascolarctobacterium sp.]
MKNIILIGMPGCGKTTFGRLLSKELNRDFHDSDEVLEMRERRTIKDFFAESEEAFRQAETRTLKYLAGLDGVIIATGGGAVKNQENMEILGENGVIIFIDRKPENIVACIDGTVRPLLAEDKMKVYDVYEQRIKLYQKYADYIVGNNGRTAETMDRLLKYVRGTEQ